MIDLRDRATRRQARRDLQQVGRRAAAAALVGHQVRHTVPVHFQPTAVRAVGQDVTYEGTVSTDAPCMRPGYLEVMAHDGPQNFTGGRLPSPVPGLFGHDDEIRLGTCGGFVLHAGTLRGEFTIWHDAPHGRKAIAAIEAGRLSAFSIGYFVDKAEYDGELDGVPVLRVTRWRLREVSLVEYPADKNCGIGRGTPRGELAALGRELATIARDLERAAQRPLVHPSRLRSEPVIVVPLDERGRPMSAAAVAAWRRRAL